MEEYYDPQEEKVINQTMEHIRNVVSLLNHISFLLKERGYAHDTSKMKDPEFKAFLKYTPKLWGTTFGSDEYFKYIEEMKPALQHHYSVNRHHPEHFENGVSGMNLVDLIEMFCDWLAATKRHKDGNIFKSIETNGRRFNMGEQLKQIFINTAKEVFKEDTP